MSSPARNFADSDGSLTSGPVVARQPSKLFPELFKTVDADRQLTVLEIGSALSETVDFFSQYNCRLHFVDLIHEPFVREQQAGLSEKELRHAFEEQFCFSADTRIDICLFWDFLCYLDDVALRAFNSALRPWLHAGTKVHGFGVHHLAISVENIQFGIISQDMLSIRNRRTAQLRSYPHSQVEMHEMLNCLDFQRGLLLPEGKLEMLLEPRS
jgi:hypothetical protein